MINTLIAQGEPIGEPLRGIGPLGLEGMLGAYAVVIIERVLSAVIGIITVIGGIWFIFIIITGGISWMSAGGDKVKISDAQQRITMGVVGLIILIGGMYLADLIGYLLGMDLLNPAQSIIDIAAGIGG